MKEILKTYYPDRFRERKTSNYQLGKFIFIAIIFLLAKPCTAYEFIITGRVMDSLRGLPIAHHQLLIINDTTNIIETVYSDVEGYYSKPFSIEDSIEYSYSIYTSNYCADSLSFLVDKVVSFEGIYDLPVYICTDISTYCYSDFTYLHVAGTTISFTDNSGGNIIYWDWDFGDGQHAYEANPIHTYEDPGLYEVALSTLTLDSCNSLVKKSIYVTTPINIDGVVYAGQSLLPSGLVMAYTLNDTGQFSPVYNTSFSISEGVFSIPLYPNTPYYLLAVPELNLPEFHIPVYFPTYYNNVTSWNESQLFIPDADTLIELHLVSQELLYYGHGSISGYTEKEGADNIESINVLLLNDEFLPIRYTYFNYDNTFAFNNLPLGNYYIWVDYIGKLSQAIPVSINEDQPYSNISLLITHHEIILSSPESILEVLDAPYPNPCSDELHIPIQNLEGAPVTFELFNSLGQLQLKKTSYNKDIVSLSIPYLESGVYILRVAGRHHIIVKN